MDSGKKGKPCAVCQIVKELHEFPLSGHKDSIKADCIVCDSDKRVNYQSTYFPKRCSSCRVPLEDGKKHSYCNPCSAKNMRDFRADNPDKVAVQNVKNTKRIIERYSIDEQFRKECKMRAKKSSVKNAEKIKNQSRIDQLKQYGLTPESFEELLEYQNNACAICGGTNIEKNRKTLVVDHDHHSGDVRGLLHSRCNVGIGYLNDDPIMLAKAIVYLTKNKKWTTEGKLKPDFRLSLGNTFGINLPLARSL